MIYHIKKLKIRKLLKEILDSTQENETKYTKEEINKIEESFYLLENQLKMTTSKQVKRNKKIN